MSLKRTIGTNALSYPEMRNFAGHAFSHYTFRKVIDLYKIPSFFLFRLFHKINRKWQNTFLDLGMNSCDFFHFFNVISLGTKPYITTYETTLPRWRERPADIRKGLSLIAKDNCKKIIALSACAYKKQTALIKKYSPELFDTIMIKNMVLLPPQIPLINDITEKRNLGKNIIFTIVGADFFRKGGQAILNAFDILLDENKPLVLNIVSTMNYGDYASKTTTENLNSAMRIIDKHKERIRLLKPLGNEAVMALLLDTDVALLPSIAETFGYFILEAQAAGCPVITTDIRAMPEINNDIKGWLIRIKNDDTDEADLTDPEKLATKITSGLMTIIRSVLENPSVITEKGKQALQDIQTYHSPEKHRQVLSEIYQNI